MTLSVFDKAADRLILMEERVATQAAQPLKVVLAKLFVRLNALWPGDDASDAQKRAALLRLNLATLQTPMVRVEGGLLAAALEALQHGVETGVTGTAVDLTVGEHVLIDSTRLSPEITAAVRGTSTAMSQQVLRGVALLGTARTQAEAETALAIAGTGINRVEAAARWVVNSASNEGLDVVTDTRIDLVSVWRCERNGCVNCMAYAGEIKVGEAYAGGLTFGATPLSESPVPRPPLHPNCRCSQYILERESAGAVAAGLKREAQRSILRGWSLQSESNKVRIDAARRLLATNPALPKSVKEYAERAIKRGEFAKGRDLP